MDAAEQLLAVEEIKRLKARYPRCMDTKDWDGFARVFAADAADRVDVPDPGPGRCRDEPDGLVVGDRPIVSSGRPGERDEG